MHRIKLHNTHPPFNGKIYIPISFIGQRQDLNVISNHISRTLVLLEVSSPSL